MKTNACVQDLKEALRAINEKFDGNICFRNCLGEGLTTKFTLTVKNSKAAGSRKASNGRRIKAACWHVHGCFFEELFQIDKNIWIETMKRKITIDGGNWEDWPIGTNFMYSQSCDCS